MQLTLHTDYALRILMYLASQPGKRVTVVELATFYNVSRNHLVKVVQGLVEHQLVETTRGKNGGMQLASDSKNISIGHVVRKMENHFNIVECFDPAQAECTLDGACRLKGVLANAADVFLSSLDNISLADLVKPRLRQHIVNLQ